MEQRNSDRKSVSLGAVVACSRFGLIRGQISDLAEGGLYVRAETSIVPIGASVTVTFRPDDQICHDCLSVRGRVAHQSLHGFGIAFEDIDAKCSAILAQLLPAMPLAPQRAMPVLRAG
ncbi:MAG: PilZ domain-containing protein [Gammaproteobacteria bacterium]|nr:PilZ domain-containing protein [Gammaproteobacteria bacterium]MCB1923794.1 PilZ domain-containing protein [Gammaproteobacteria bacterium]